MTVSGPLSIIQHTCLGLLDFSELSAVLRSLLETSAHARVKGVTNLAEMTLLILLRKVEVLLAGLCCGLLVRLNLKRVVLARVDGASSVLSVALGIQIGGHSLLALGVGVELAGPMD